MSGLSPLDRLYLVGCDLKELQVYEDSLLDCIWNIRERLDRTIFRLRGMADGSIPDISNGIPVVMDDIGKLRGLQDDVKKHLMDLENLGGLIADQLEEVAERLAEREN